VLIKIKTNLKICQCSKCKNCYFDSENENKLCRACFHDIHNQ